MDIVLPTDRGPFYLGSLSKRLDESNDRFVIHTMDPECGPLLVELILSQLQFYTRGDLSLSLSRHLMESRSTPEFFMNIRGESHQLRVQPLPGVITDSTWYINLATLSRLHPSYILGDNLQGSVSGRHLWAQSQNGLVKLSDLSGGEPVYWNPSNREPFVPTSEEFFSQRNSTHHAKREHSFILGNLPIPLLAELIKSRPAVFSFQNGFLSSFLTTHLTDRSDYPSSFLDLEDCLDYLDRSFSPLLGLCSLVVPSMTVEESRNPVIQKFSQVIEKGVTRDSYTHLIASRQNEETQVHIFDCSGWASGTDLLPPRYIQWAQQPVPGAPCLCWNLHVPSCLDDDPRCFPREGSRLEEEFFTRGS